MTNNLVPLLDLTGEPVLRLVERLPEPVNDPIRWEVCLNFAGLSPRNPDDALTREEQAEHDALMAELEAEREADMEVQRENARQGWLASLSDAECAAVLAEERRADRAAATKKQLRAARSSRPRSRAGKGASPKRVRGESPGASSEKSPGAGTGVEDGRLFHR